MYLCERARPDIGHALSYLCTRLSSPSNDDKDELNRVIAQGRLPLSIPGLDGHLHLCPNPIGLIVHYLLLWLEV